MRCVICNSTDKWENVDQFRHAPQGMHICTGCGFVSYPSKYKTEAEIKKYYEKDYRNCPTISNAFTGQKKLHIHSAFLTDTLKKWQADGKKSPVVCDVGAAYGVFLNWIRQHFRDADLNGTEYALAYRRNAWHEYKIKLGVDFDSSKKYDLISSFKVAEHQLDVDKRLREYTECLAPDGVLYISVPIWFSKMGNFGLDGWDLEYYYDPNHINVWTEKLFVTLLHKCGLEIIKTDHWMYDSTYLCKRNDEMMKIKPEYEQPANIKQIMRAIKEASLAYEQHDFENAVNKFPNFPVAWTNYYEKARATAHQTGQSQPPLEFVKTKFLAPAMKACPYSLEILRMAADIHMRYGDFEGAATICQQALDARPNHASFLMTLAHCFREIGLRAKDPADKIRMLTESRDCAKYLKDVDLLMRNEAVSWVYRDNSEIPTPHEH
jgi:SAM-dependent methyltransferase